MKRIIEGYRRFRSQTQESRGEFFATLAQKPQRPQALLITCSDSRIDPNLITGTEPGDLFLVRNAGNLVPPYGPSPGATTAAIEYAVAALKVRSIIICGHSHCGAMTALLDPKLVQGLPAVSAWLGHAESTRRVFHTKHAAASDEERLTLASGENVLTQLANLTTHPAVAVAMAQGELDLYGWMYFIESGQLHGFCPSEGRFLPLDEHDAEAMPNPTQLKPSAIT